MDTFNLVRNYFAKAENDEPDNIDAGDVLEEHAAILDDIQKTMGCDNLDLYFNLDSGRIELGGGEISDISDELFDQINHYIRKLTPLYFFDKESYDYYLIKELRKKKIEKII